MLRGVIILGLAMAATGCRGVLAGDRFSKDGLAYRVVVPDDGKGWRRVDFADNDLAWISNDSAHVIAVNATCTGHEDPPLDVLTKHLVIGFTDRDWIDQKAFTLDGRDALRSRVTAKLDGVPAAIELVVVKKNGCVHDFSYISPLGREAVHQPEFDALVAGFAQERAP
ncbi:MAG: hypothetical protein DI536_04585 [Archangium gephyra]|uniref:Lipoprotein n=1 Tax=Archangium gephyra TaxID=48 RepID=A0A2W5U221_9BACT|nr:MAG: hypothetical protein DI536_04585 [Archangium gephyra]